MKKLLAVTLVLGAIAVSPNAAAGDALSQSAIGQIDAGVKALSDAQVRVLNKAVTFCAASQQPKGNSLEAGFKSYIEAFSAGTRAGMMEIAKSDKDILRSIPVYQGKDFEMMDKQGELLLKQVQTSPAPECTKLETLFNSGTTASFKEGTLQSHREFKAKRAEYCARVPKPGNCG